MVKTTIEIDENLWKKFSMLVIRKRGYRKKNEVIEQLIRDYVKSESQYDLSEAMVDFESEKSAFKRMYDELSKDDSYMGKYVVVIGGKVVDSDSDKIRLAERTYDKYGYLPIYIGYVGPQRFVEVPSPEARRT